MAIVKKSLSEVSGKTSWKFSATAANTRRAHSWNASSAPDSSAAPSRGNSQNARFSTGAWILRRRKRWRISSMRNRNPCGENGVQQTFRGKSAAVALQFNGVLAGVAPRPFHIDCEAVAEKQMSGLIGSTVRTERGKLLHILAEVESRLDFPEEDLDWLPPENLNAVLNGCIKVIERMIRSRENGAILRNGMRVVIAGRPNSGKSSLLNALLGYDRAIVTPLPGTTRDTLEEFASFHGIPVRLTDTAGLRETAADPIENMGISRSRDSMRSAEIIFWVMDASSPAAAQESLEYMNSQIRDGSNLIVVWNKIDLNPDPERLPLLSGTPSVRISALRGEGLENLLDVFENRVWHKSESPETECEVSARHAGLLESAKSELQQAAREIASGFWELAASCLHAAIAALGGVTGEDANPDMLDEIFSRFCIGK